MDSADRHASDDRKTGTQGWDPVAALPEGEPEGSFHGQWQNRSGLNVPGPFYTAGADGGWTGRGYAPRHVLYADRSEGYGEFVYRQPKTPAEVRALALAAAQDMPAAWACDGDLHWTPTAVRQWWHARRVVEEYIATMLVEWETSQEEDEREAAVGLRDYEAYLADELADDLRAYVFRLEHGRYPGGGDVLPEL
ncbi:hypothetical protein OG749_34400 [Streptomyces nojiriensis]|uniref:hypothetical protein n=1 Tax=Streptomyces nojiriensis TaxID=66374 RepID=UPI002E17401C